MAGPRRSTICISVLAVAFWLGVSVAADDYETTMMRDLNVRVCARREHSSRLRRLIRDCERAIDRTLPGPPRMRDGWVTFSVAAADRKPPTLPPLGREILLSTDMSAQTVADTCARALLARRFPAVDGAAAGLRWWASALVFDVLYARTPDRQFSPDYSPLTALIRADRDVSPVVLCEHAVGPRWPYAYRLYATYCHALLQALSEWESDASPPAFAITDRLLAGGSFMDAWRDVSQASPRSVADPRAWFRSEIERLAAQGAGTSSAEGVGAVVRSVLGVAVLAPGPDGKIKYRRVPLHELRDRFPDTRIDWDQLREKEKQIFELLKGAPLILQRPLGNYMAALQARKDGMAWSRFLAMLQEADLELEHALERYQEANRMLDNLEQQYGITGRGLIPYLKIAREHASARDALAPQTASFLDRYAAQGLQPSPGSLP